MNIGKAAAASGISAKMIRHYETVGLIPRPLRSSAGYRRYETVDVQRLRFVRSARAAGFTTADIKKLLSLWQDQRRPAREVKRLAQTHLMQIQAQIVELSAIVSGLTHLIAHCTGNERPECPILEAFGHGALTSQGARAGFGLLSQKHARRRTTMASSKSGK
jgi:MerR family copper efflux transcriptional regulator